MKDESKLDFVDAMRGIAILMVIAVHTSQKFSDLSPALDVLTQYCQMGVQLFFVASAYTLCISQERREGEPYAIRSFYIRRYFRIAPLYYLAIPIYFLCGLALQLAKIQSVLTTEPYTLTNIISNVLFVHGFVKEANNNIVPGGWSIGTEMAFYLIFPLLFNVINRLAARGSLQILICICAVEAANVAINILISATTSHSISNNNFIYFNLINQIPVFLVGFLAYYVVKPGSNNAPRGITLILFVFFTAIAIFLWQQQIKIYFSLIPTISALSFLFLLLFLRNFRFSQTTLARVGQVSYSMYIFHFLFAWVMGGMLVKLAKRMPIVINPDVMFVIIFVIVCLVTYRVALLTQKIIEEHGIAFGSKIIRGIRSA